MIPVEYLWLTTILVFAVIGLSRGLWKELGVTTVLLLSLFVLNLGAKLILEQLANKLPANMLAKSPEGAVQALYYSLVILFVAFVAYQGITLEFPVKKQTGVFKWLFGFLGGLLNGYLIVGTVWGVIHQAKYFGLQVPWGATGQTIQISEYLTKFQGSIVKYLPVALMNSSEFVPYVFLAVGMILLIAIILK
jgi:uncharacterized membrane protein required for colicin V production